MPEPKQNSEPSIPFSKLALGSYLLMLLIITINTVISTTHIAKSTPKYNRLMDDISGLVDKVENTVPEINSDIEQYTNFSDSNYIEKITKKYKTSKNNLEKLDSILKKEEISSEFISDLEDNLENFAKIAGKQRAEFTKDDILVLGPHKDGSHTLISIKTLDVFRICGASKSIKTGELDITFPDEAVMINFYKLVKKYEKQQRDKNITLMNQEQ
jgi:hypothetical protein